MERGIDLVRGHAKFVGPRAIEVEGTRFGARKIVVATGSAPRALPIPGAEHLITSEDLLELPALPDSLTFVGAGVIAFEFAHVLARAGTSVTLLEVAPRVLPALDADAAAQIDKLTRSLGVRIETSVQIDSIEKRCGDFAVHYRGSEQAGSEQNE